LLLGFVLFRLLDILKPWPISYIDRKIKSALGVMLDDMVAGGLVLLIWLC
jgi:phosphatidylglycerophosphatase A